MDSCLEILLPKLKPLPELQEATRVFSWGGEDHPQGDSVYQWRKDTELFKVPTPRHVLARLPHYYSTGDWEYFRFADKSVSALERIINSHDTADWTSADVVSLLQSQLALHAGWALVFEPHCDQIDRVFEADLEVALSQLRSSLDWSREPVGFIAFHRHSS